MAEWSYVQWYAAMFESTEVIVDVHSITDARGNLVESWSVHYHTDMMAYP